MAITITDTTARAAAMDGANRQMKRDGRTEWSESDWNLACTIFAKLMGQPLTAPPEST